MAVKASATITLTSYRDTQSVTRYYKLQTAGSSAPLKPETKPPSSDWTDSEPACDISKELYFCDLTIFSNGEGEYSKVSKSTSYEAAKEAYNKAQGAKDSIDNLEIGGRNLLTNPVYFLADGLISNGITFNRTSNPSAWKIKGTATSEITASLIGFTNTSTPTDSTILLKEGQTYTESVKVEGSWSDSAYIAVGISNSSGSWLSQANLYPNKAKSHTFTATAKQYALRYWTVRIPSGESVDCTIYLKFEKGNRATDWTPAPEDVDAGIANAQETADSIANNIYVPDSTLLDGSKISDGSLSINQMDDTVAGTYSDPTTKKGTMEWKDDALHIKSTDSNEQNTYETVIGGDGIKFKWNGEETASIDQDELRINKTVVINAMEVGNWSWAIHPTTGNLMVKWNGGE